VWDLVLAERVITEDQQLDGLRARCEQHGCRLLARHAPVAWDLRLVVTGIHAADRIERMGDLARHVAELARRRHPDCAVPAELTGQFTEMGRRAVTAARGVDQIIVEQIIAAPHREHVTEQDRADDRTRCTARSSPR